MLCIVCWLLVVCCLLFDVSWLLEIGRWLLAIDCLLLAVCCCIVLVVRRALVSHYSVFEKLHLWTHHVYCQHWCLFRCHNAITLNIWRALAAKRLVRLEWVVRGRSSLRKKVKKRIGKEDVVGTCGHRMSRNDQTRRLSALWHRIIGFGLDGWTINPNITRIWVVNFTTPPDIEWRPIRYIFVWF